MTEKERIEELEKLANDLLISWGYDNGTLIKRVNDFDDTVEFDTPDDFRITFDIKVKKMTQFDIDCYEKPEDENDGNV